MIPFFSKKQKKNKQHQVYYKSVAATYIKIAKDPLFLLYCGIMHECTYNNTLVLALPALYQVIIECKVHFLQKCMILVVYYEHLLIEKRKNMYITFKRFVE